MAGLASALAAAACGGDGIDGRFATPYQNVREMVRHARANVTEIRVSQLRPRLESRQQLLLIDVREPDEFDEGHIEGAMNIPRGVLEFRMADEEFWDIWGLYVPTKDDLIVLYGGAEHRGALAAASLRKLGYRRATSLIGGFDAWATGKDFVEEEPDEPKKEAGCD